MLNRIPVPDDAKERAELDRQNRAFAAGCQQTSGRVLPYVGTDVTLLIGNFHKDRVARNDDVPPPPVDAPADDVPRDALRQLGYLC